MKFFFRNFAKMRIAAENKINYKPSLTLGEEYNFFYFNIPLTIRTEALDNDP